MDMGGVHGMGGMAPTPSPPGAPPHHGGGRMHMMHMTFYWGKNSLILFTRWPGTSGGMYVLALVAIFTLAFLLEFLGSRGLDALLPAADAAGKRRRVAAARVAVHAVRVGVAYLLMLALMSFNGGVFLVAVVGHAAGFLVFKAGLFGDRLAQAEGGGTEHAIC